MKRKSGLFTCIMRQPLFLGHGKNKTSRMLTYISLIIRDRDMKLWGNIHLVTRDKIPKFERF